MVYYNILKETTVGIIRTLDLYSYLDDDHIDTALRKYVKERNLWIKKSYS